MAANNIPVEPPILYWGTPVVLNSTENPNGTFNLAPISSVFWLGGGAYWDSKRRLRRRRT